MRGAGEGNRTLVVSLGSFCSAIELHPQRRDAACHKKAKLVNRCYPRCAGSTNRELDDIYTYRVALAGAIIRTETDAVPHTSACGLRIETSTSSTGPSARQRSASWRAKTSINVT